jgi:hypothetical protein
VLDLDANDSNGGGADYTATFTSGGPAIPIADIDDSITDADSTTIASATITIGINRQPDDVLTINGSLPAGITASSYDASTGVITLSGAASFADYQTALRQVVYSSPNPTPFTGDRVIDVACTRFRGHRVRCHSGAGGGLWNANAMHENSSLRL